MLMDNKRQEKMCQIIKIKQIIQGAQEQLIYPKFHTKVRWADSQQNDELKEQLVISASIRQSILEFKNNTYTQKDFIYLIEDTDSEEIMKQLRGVIGLRILLSNQDNYIIYQFYHLVNLSRISKLLEMIDSQIEPQLQLESLRLLNFITNGWNRSQHICLMVAQAGGTTKLTKLLSKGKIQILSRVILILGNLCKCRYDLRIQLIREGTIQRLISAAENNGNDKIKLQSLRVLILFLRYYSSPLQTSNQNIILSFSCKMMMENSLLPTDSLFYYCCETLRKSSAVDLIVQYRVYQKILEVDIQTNQAILSHCLGILALASLKSITSEKHGQLLIKKGICDFVQKYLSIYNGYFQRNSCYCIVMNLAKISPYQIESLMQHQSLIPKMTQLLKQRKINIRNAKNLQIPQVFTQIFNNMATTSGLQFRQFQSKLIDWGIIEILIQIMRACISNNTITNNVLETVCILLQQKQQFRASHLHALLQKLGIVRILESISKSSYEHILPKTIAKISKYFDVSMNPI